jgi:hypothetical protein
MSFLFRSLARRQSPARSRRRLAKSVQCVLQPLEQRCLLSASGLGSASPTGLTPSQISTYYGIDEINFDGVPGTGAGQTIAIIAPYDDASMVSSSSPQWTESDLYRFSQQFGLSTTFTFTKINQNGGTTYPSSGANNGWANEIALDVEWSHAIAPDANIVLVEADNSDFTNLFAAVNTARNMPGVSVVSMSFGLTGTPNNETSDETSDDSYFTTPNGHSGITFLGATGDEGSVSEYPAFSPNVVAVGGTSITNSGEVPWTGGGSGVSEFESKPAYQDSVTTPSATQRTNPDVSMDADPNSGVAVLDTSSSGIGTSDPWLDTPEGGTSLATPMWAGLIAIADQGRSALGLGTLNGFTQTLPELYSLDPSDFNEVGSAVRYNTTTGLGSPIANLLIPDLAGGNTITGTVFNDAGDTGLFNSADSGLSGVTVQLVNSFAANSIIATTTTNSSGDYTFSDVYGNDYQIQEVTPSGYRSTSTTSLTVRPTYDNTISGVNFGNVQNVVAGTVWKDANGDGVRESSESPMSGVTVMLLSGNSVVLQTTTNALGQYNFSPAAGSYSIQVVDPLNYLYSPQGQSSDPALNSDVNQYGQSAVFNFASSPQIINVGLRPQISTNIIYVDSTATGFDNGTSWANAYTNLQFALLSDNAVAGDTVEVAAGTYSPGPEADDFFQLISGVTIQGGYAPGGSAAPNPANNLTILSGGGVNLHVVSGQDTDSTAVLDGFTITGGAAGNDPGGNNADSAGFGGGMFNYQSSCTVIDCTFTGNSAGFNGGGMYNNQSSPTVVDCLFTGNSSLFSGGGMLNNDSSPTLLGCTFTDNTASTAGGGILNSGSTATLIGCAFNSNTALIGGGLFNNATSALTLTNTTFSFNTAGTFGGALVNDATSSVTATGCTFWNDSAPSEAEIANVSTTASVTYSDIQGGFAGLGNANSVPTPAAAMLAVSQQPANAIAGTTQNPIVVKVENQFGNVVTSDNSDVTLTINDNPITVAAQNGVATFTNIAVNTAGTYAFTASDGALATAQTNDFAISPAAANHLIFTVQPTSTIVDSTISPIDVAVVDAFGNLVPTDSSTVTLSVKRGPLQDTTTLAAVNGVASFSFNSTVVGIYRLRATDGTLGSVNSLAFSVNPGVQSQAVIASVPAETDTPAAAPKTFAEHEASVVPQFQSDVGIFAGTFGLLPVNGLVRSPKFFL